MATRRQSETARSQRGLLIICLFGLAAIIGLSFIGAAGTLGQWINVLFGWVFGWVRWGAPIALAGIAWAILRSEDNTVNWRQYVGGGLLWAGLTGLLELQYSLAEMTAQLSSGDGGGLIGLIIAYPLLRLTGVWVAGIITIGMIAAGLVLLFTITLNDMRRWWDWAVEYTSTLRDRLSERMERPTTDTNTEEEDLDEESEQDDEELAEDNEEPIDEEDEFIQTKDIEAPTAAIEVVPVKRHGKLDIPTNLLDDKNEKPTSGDIELNKLKIKKTLASFKIEVDMGDINIGPMVTQYTLRPADGVKLNQITGLSNDIALALAAHPIRIEAPIPGKSLVGIEIPNKVAATVTVKELIASKAFKQRGDNLTICIGKDVSGKPAFRSLMKMPHLLIAGATGSGKSVCINGLIISLLYQNSPDDLRFIMVDPKRVELSVYNGIPHLLTPVITEPEKTINALKWAVSEMDRRYEVLSAAGKRNIESFNASRDAEDRLPYIVFIIDELADLMSVAASSVEAAIVRLAQMSRAIGIHLVLATQRPSVNVITGLIKANMPARIAFSVTSLVDSRTILDFSGAEKLLGRGDMLYIDSQQSKPARFQGAFLGDQEIERVVEYLRAEGEPSYNADIVDTVTRGAAGSTFGDSSEEDDPLLPEAKDIILQAGKASASLMQRRLKVGYARAARILDILEEQGFIGPADGAKPREILATSANDEPVEEEISNFDRGEVG